MELGLDHIPQHRRELFLKVWAGYFPIHEITYPLFYLDSHMPEAKLDAALRWLLKNKLTGKAFVAFHRHDCIGSNLQMIRHLTAKLEREGVKGLRLIAGKDVRV